MTRWDALLAEHDALHEQTVALRREHDDLHNRPVDLAEHKAHRVKLNAHIDNLHAHIDKWKHLQR